MHPAWSRAAAFPSVPRSGSVCSRGFHDFPISDSISRLPPHPKPPDALQTPAGGEAGPLGLASSAEADRPWGLSGGSSLKVLGSTCTDLVEDGDLCRAGPQARDSLLHWPAVHSHFCQWLWGTLFLKGGLAPPKDRASVHPLLHRPQAFPVPRGGAGSPQPRPQSPSHVRAGPTAPVRPCRREPGAAGHGPPSGPGSARAAPPTGQRQRPHWVKLTLVTPFCRPYCG